MGRFTRRGRTGSAKRAEQDGIAREAFRVLRSNLLIAISELDNSCVVITSASAGEGKTSTSVAIAQSLAAAGSRVVLVDGDLRSPDAHRLVGVANKRGLSDVLSGTRSLQECLQKVTFAVPDSTRQVSMSFLAAGTAVSDPAELLSSARTEQVLAQLAIDADVVLIDAPPVLPVADTLVLGRFAAGILLVVEARRTPIPEAKRARDVLARNQMRLLGVVLNKFDAKHAPPEYETVGGRRNGSYGDRVRLTGVDDRPRAQA
jgi:capsular exopolysaccharide synthesis family protein